MSSSVLEVATDVAQAEPKRFVVPGGAARYIMLQSVPFGANAEIRYRSALEDPKPLAGSFSVDLVEPTSEVWLSWDAVAGGTIRLIVSLTERFSGSDIGTDISDRAERLLGVVTLGGSGSGGTAATVATAGGVQLAAQPCSEVLVQNDADSTENLLVGLGGSGAVALHKLEPGQAMTFTVNDQSQVWVKSVGGTATAVHTWRA